MNKTRRRSSGSDTLRVGYVPLIDAAPLIVADELGMFEREGLMVDLQKQLGWATVRDKMVQGELDASHAVVGLPFAMSAGIGCRPVPCIAPIVLNLHGNAVTLTVQGLRPGADPLESLKELAARTGVRPVFGVVSMVSSHRFLLTTCLGQHGWKEGADYELAVVPPSLMCRNLEVGTIHGFCAGEPWNSLAVRHNLGVVISTSPQLAMGHPEKVLMCREDWSENHVDELAALIRALKEACEFCDAEPAQTARLLSHPDVLDLPVSLLLSSLQGETGSPTPDSRLHVFSKFDANRPDCGKADWILRHMESAGLVTSDFRQEERRRRRIFREDLFNQATSAGATRKTRASLVALTS